eukprot:TRINITY_DN36944_c0_g1_i1.p1 TRINITY_DN36944_c0_g1~~TRINITY_DN36944_c0_g1_i1.p1  ORF type:complete len:161 (+),score=34.13 TRINITY_DN36944_c0_g1_i1:1-483(+)
MYTILFVGSVRCVQETDQRRVHGDKPLDHLCFQNYTNILFAGSSQLTQIKIFTLDLNTQNLIYWKTIQAGYIGGICSLNERIYFNYQENNSNKVITSEYQVDKDEMIHIQTSIVSDEMQKNLQLPNQEIQNFAGPIISQKPNLLMRAIGYDIQLISLALA